MRTYYCDGSQCKDIDVIGIGIVGRTTELGVEIPNLNWDLQNHEVEAIIKTIEFSFEDGAKKIKIINDDRMLVGTIKKMLKGEKVKSKGLIRKERFRYLVGLIKQHEVKVGIPKTEIDKQNIKKCHDLSRIYLAKIKED